jgi:hypothetical protein
VIKDVKGIYREGDAKEDAIMANEDDLVRLVPGLPAKSARVFLEAMELQARKNADYADSKADPYRNFRMCAEGDIPVWKGVWVRLGDKWSRLQKYVKGSEMAVSSESGRDTMLDLINYACIMLATHDEEDNR